MSSLEDLGRNPLSGICFENIYFQSMADLLISLTVSFDEQCLFFKSYEVHLTYFLWFVFFCVLRNHRLAQGHKNFLLCFIGEVHMGLSFTLNYFLYVV